MTKKSSFTNFYSTDKTSPVSAENIFNHLKGLQMCLELNGFTEKSAIVSITPITRNFGFESVIC